MDGNSCSEFHKLVALWGYFWQETNIPCLVVTAKLLPLMPMFQCFNVWIYQTEPECTHSRAESTALVITVGICLPIIAVVIQVIVGSRRISWITIRLSRFQAQQCILCLTTGGPLLKHLCSPLITLYTILTIRNLLIHAKWVQCTPRADVVWAIISKAIRRQLKNSSNRRALEMFFVQILVSQVAGRIFLIGEGRVNREIVRSLSERQVHKCRILSGVKIRSHTAGGSTL